MKKNVLRWTVLTALAVFCLALSGVVMASPTAALAEEGLEEQAARQSLPADAIVIGDDVYRVINGVVHELDDGRWQPEYDKKIENGVLYEWDDDRRVWERDDDNDKPRRGTAQTPKAQTPKGSTNSGVQQMYRLYNPNSGEHFYTGSAHERNHLASLGWRYEGVGWNAPKKSSEPVYRLYNPNAGDHHYTTSKGERDMLKRAGWRDEGIGWYSNPAKTVPLFRQYNPNARCGSHNFTANANENTQLVRAGWRAEGIAWYGC